MDNDVQEVQEETKTLSAKFTLCCALHDATYHGALGLTVEDIPVSVINDTDVLRKAFKSSLIDLATTRAYIELTNDDAQSVLINTAQVQSITILDLEIE